MTIGIASRGSGGTRDLLCCFLGGADVSARLDPTAVVLTESGPATDAFYQNGPERGLSTYPELLAAGREAAQGATIGRVILIGFSRGCQAIRTHVGDGYLPDAAVCCDGTHSPIPPGGANFAIWQKLVDNAKSGGPPFATSHSCIVTEPSFSSTHATLEALTGVQLPCGPDIVSLGEYTSGNLTVLSVGGTTGEAHIYQANSVLPLLIERVLSQATAGTGASYAGGTRSVLRWLAMGVGLVGGVLGAGVLMED